MTTAGTPRAANTTRRTPTPEEINRPTHTYGVRPEQHSRKNQLHSAFRTPSREIREAQKTIELAHTWVPYGGVPAELTFQTFGITTRQFVDRLWQAVQATNCSYPVVRDLSPVYPRNGHRAMRLSDS